MMGAPNKGLELNKDSGMFLLASNDIFANIKYVHYSLEKTELLSESGLL